MKKRVLCLIGAVALVLSSFFVLPAAAAYEPDVYAQELSSYNGDTTYNMVDGLTVGNLYFIGETLFVAVGDPLRITSSGYIPNGLEFTYDGERCVVVGLNTLDNTVTITQIDGSTPSEAYFYIYTAVDTGGSSEGTYQEGYDAGYDVGYGDGYDEGYDNGTQITNGYDVGYSKGFQNGKSEGLAAGRVEGLEQAATVFDRLPTSVLLTARYYAVLKLSDSNGVSSEVYYGNIQPDFYSDSVGFSSFHDRLFSNHPEYEETLDGVYIFLEWTEPDYFNYVKSPLQIQGSTLVESGLLYTTNGTLSVSASSGSSSDLRTFEITSDYSLPVMCNRFRIYVGRPYDLLNEFVLCSTSVLTGNAYANGFADGALSSDEETFNEGKAKGFSEGFGRGKAEGLEIAELGNWSSLMTAVVDAPFNALTSLFSFEILGLDMRVAFGSLLALCMFLFVVKKVIL